MKQTFLGAARGVAGFSYLVEHEGVRFLVDCGMFQGGRETRAKNHQAFAFDPATIASSSSHMPTSTTPACCRGWWRGGSRAASIPPVPPAICSP